MACRLVVVQAMAPAAGDGKAASVNVSRLLFVLKTAHHA